MATRKSKKTQSQKQEQKVSQNGKIILGEIKAKRKKRKKAKKTPPQGRSETVFIDNRQWQPRVIYGGYGPAGSNIETARTVQQTAYQQQALPIARETPRGIPQMSLQGTQTDILPPPPEPLSQPAPAPAPVMEQPKPPPVERGDTSRSELGTAPKPPVMEKEPSGERTSLPSARKGKQRGLRTLQSILRNESVMEILPPRYLTTLGEIQMLPTNQQGLRVRTVFDEIEPLLSTAYGKDASNMTANQIIKEAEKKNKK